MAAPLERLRRDARTIYDAALASVEPGKALRRILAAAPPPEGVAIIAIGKAARSMAHAAAEHLAALEIPLRTGIVVASDPGEPVGHHLLEIIGDHPLPGERSRDAAEAVATTARDVGAHDEAWVLLSGGASSLVGAPVDDIPDGEYRTLMADLFRAGLPIGELNAARKRFSRFGGGRLLAALAADRVRVFALSDVIGDDPADIGSGPCEPDPQTAAEVRRRLRAADIALPPGIDAWLATVEQGGRPETPKPSDPVFARCTTRIVGSNQTALGEAAAAARSLGYRAVVIPTPVAGPAAAAGRHLAAALLATPFESGPVALLAGGECTVRLDADAGLGGRCQEAALAAAEVLSQSSERNAVLLAAGTDGRDGPTDAAGALVDSTTWSAIVDQGGAPATSLARHDSHRALALAKALVVTGPTGTNVMDLMIGLVD